MNKTKTRYKSSKAIVTDGIDVGSHQIIWWLSNHGLGDDIRLPGGGYQWKYEI